MARPPFEDVSEINHPSLLKIPPLKSMFPTATPDRPMMLEPYTSLNADEEDSRLLARQMALAQALTMEALKPSELGAIDCANPNESDLPKIDPLEEFNKKKRKLRHHEQLADFVHLPKPKPKLEEVNQRPFRPIAVLHQLNEPPPSAALFPPITPSQEEHVSRDSVDAGANEGAKHHCGGRSTLKGLSRNISSSTPPKRNYTRERRRWTDAETNDLKEGIALCGVGRWKAILEHPKFHFQEGRTHVDLKDKFRTLYPPNHPEKWAEQMAEMPKDLIEKLPTTRASRRQLTGKRVPYRSWTEEEDIELDKGFEKHGFQWHLIAQDASLHFDRRSANQIRDRFRRRHREQYEEEPPALAVDKSYRNRDKPPGFEKPTVRKANRALRESNDTLQPSASGNKKVRPSRGGQGVDQGLSDRFTVKVTKAPSFPSDLLNGDVDDEGSEFSRSLAALGDDLKLPPLQWEDLTPQPFDFG